MLFIFMISSVNAVLTIEIDPVIPEPKDTVTFTVTIPEEDVENVVINVEECKEDICFVDTFNETMDSIGSSKYQTTITLKYEDATEIKYRVGYNNSSGWKWYPEGSNARITANLDKSEDENGGDGNNTPGFEFLLIILTFIFSVVFVKRVRKK